MMSSKSSPPCSSEGSESPQSLCQMMLNKPVDYQPGSKRSLRELGFMKDMNIDKNTDGDVTSCRVKFASLLQNAVDLIMDCDDNDSITDEAFEQHQSLSHNNSLAVVVDKSECFEDSWSISCYDYDEDDLTLSKATDDPPFLVPQKKRGEASRVRFGAVNVRVYGQILSDNPCSTDGPSLGIGWDFEEREVNVDEYREYRAPMGRRGSQLWMSKETRLEIARGLGYSESEIAENSRSQRKFREQRKIEEGRLKAKEFNNAVQDARREVAKSFVQGNNPVFVKGSW